MTTLSAHLARHWPRLTLAVLWTIGGEVLAWSFSPERTLLDWLLILLGYTACAYALTDLAVRWRMRDLYGVAALGGLAAVLCALLINPTYMLEDIPRTFVTRALGAHGLILMGMLLLWLVLLDVLPLRRLMLPIAAVMGICWGTWVRYGPQFTALPAPLISTDTFALVGVLLVGSIIAVAAIGTRFPAAPPERLLLDQYEAGFVAAVFIALLYRQLDLGTVDMVSRGLVIGVIGLCLAMMWFRKDSTYTYFMRPISLRPAWPLLLGSLLLVLIGALAAFNTPVLGDETFNQTDAVVLLFGFFGLAWLPGVAVILGLRAVLRSVSVSEL